MDNIVALKLNCYKGFSFEEAIEGVKRSGFKYVEIMASPNNSSGISRFASFSELTHYKQRFKEENIIPIGLGGHTDIMDENIYEDFINNIRLAKFFECKYMISSIGGNNHKTEDIVNSINKLIPELESNDINLTIEIHGNYHDGKTLKEICDLVNSKRVGINYDAANAVFYGNISNEELLSDMEYSINNISYMHLKDKSGLKNEWNFPALGKGWMPLINELELLNKHHNNCPLSVEIEFTKEGVKDIKEVHQATLDSMKYLKSLNLFQSLNN